MTGGKKQLDVNSLGYIFHKSITLGNKIKRVAWDGGRFGSLKEIHGFERTSTKTHGSSVTALTIFFSI